MIHFVTGACKQILFSKLKHHRIYPSSVSLRQKFTIRKIAVNYPRNFKEIIISLPHKSSSSFFFTLYNLNHPPLLKHFFVFTMDGVFLLTHVFSPPSNPLNPNVQIDNYSLPYPDAPVPCSPRDGVNVTRDCVSLCVHQRSWFL